MALPFQRVNLWNGMQSKAFMDLKGPRNEQTMHIVFEWIKMRKVVQQIGRQNELPRYKVWTKQSTKQTLSCIHAFGLRCVCFEQDGRKSPARSLDCSSRVLFVESLLLEPKVTLSSSSQNPSLLHMLSQICSWLVFDKTLNNNNGDCAQHAHLPKVIHDQAQSTSFITNRSICKCYFESLPCNSSCFLF